MRSSMDRVSRKRRHSSDDSSAAPVLKKTFVCQVKDILTPSWLAHLLKCISGSSEKVSLTPEHFDQRSDDFTKARHSVFASLKDDDSPRRHVKAKRRGGHSVELYKKFPAFQPPKDIERLPSVVEFINSSPKAVKTFLNVGKHSWLSKFHQGGFSPRGFLAVSEIASRRISHSNGRNSFKFAKMVGSRLFKVSNLHSTFCYPSQTIYGGLGNFRSLNFPKPSPYKMATHRLKPANAKLKLPHAIMSVIGQKCRKDAGNDQLLFNPAKYLGYRKKCVTTSKIPQESIFVPEDSRKLHVESETAKEMPEYKGQPGNETSSSDKDSSAVSKGEGQPDLPLGVVLQPENSASSSDKKDSFQEPTEFNKGEKSASSFGALQPAADLNVIHTSTSNKVKQEVLSTKELVSSRSLFAALINKKVEQFSKNQSAFSSFTLRTTDAPTSYRNATKLDLSDDEKSAKAASSANSFVSFGDDVYKPRPSTPFPRGFNYDSEDDESEDDDSTAPDDKNKDYISVAPDDKRKDETTDNKSDTSYSDCEDELAAIFGTDSETSVCRDDARSTSAIGRSVSAQ